MKAEDFSRYLRGLRKEKKLTIRQLDMYSGVSHSYISQMERGDRGIPSPDILKKLAKPLGVEYEELMERAGYITKEEVFKNALKEGYLGDVNSTDVVDDKTKEFMKQMFEDPETILKLAGKDATDAFLKEMFSMDGYSDFWDEMIQIALTKKGINPEKTQEIVNELEDLSDNEVEDVIDFIRYKKSKLKEK